MKEYCWVLAGPTIKANAPFVEDLNKGISNTTMSIPKMVM
jgi:hypothetical protein